MKCLSRFESKLFVTLLILPFVFSVQSFAQENTAATKLTAVQWQNDVKFLAEEMPKQHPNLFRRMKREDFEAAVKKFHDQIPTLSEEEIVVGLMKITALVKDGHTGVFPHSFFRTGFYPVRFYLYKDGLFVQRAATEYAEAVGGRVVKIGNAKTDDALKLSGELVSGDNEMGKKENAPLLLSIPEILAGLKINDDKQNLKLVVEVGGTEKTFQVKPAATLAEIIRPPSNWSDANSAKSQTQLYLKDPNNIYWFEYLKDKKIIYVRQNAVQNKPEETIAAFYKRVFETVAANPVEKFVLDLRNNDGGNNGLNRQAVIGLIKSKIDECGKLFVITGRRTFSAAQNFVNEIEKYTNAIFVGEPTAGRPNHYGDARPVNLPNSELEVRVSTIYWQDVDPRDVRQWTAPEIAVELSSEDYRNNQDPVLQAVFDYVPGSTMADIIAEAAKQNDVAGFVKKYREFKTNSKYKFAETEAQINRFGYALLQKQKAGDAIEVFKLNAESYPESANVYDSLGDAYQAAGKKDEAVKSYEKALSINPQLPSSIEALKKLKGQ